MSSTAVVTNEEQAKHLEDSLLFIRQQEALMRKCLESKGKLLDAIRHASTFLAELRSSTLSPKQYYEMYIAVFDALSYLGGFLREDHPTHHLADIYELVQYAGNIVPRLYLMITVGTVYMSVPDAPVKEIMKDMMEMCRGVQHPIRGLFLRYYLSQGARDHLPTGTSEGPEGNLKDSIQFIITNFIEMNKLWVRLQHQGHSRERDKRTKERQELQILVGSNLVRLSQLEGIDKEYYRSSILPAILEQVVQCRDVLAQDYLLDVICQVFPDEFHLYSLDLFLNATRELNPAVSVRKTLLAMINRLADYASRERELDSETTLSKALEGLALESDETLFDKIWSHFGKLVQERPDLPAQDKTALLVGICKLSLNWYPSNIDYVDRILDYAIKCTKEAPPKEAIANVLDVLLCLINFYPKFLSVLSIPSYRPLLAAQPIATQRTIAGAVLESVLNNDDRITEVEDVNGIFALMEIIITDEETSEEEQSKLARIVHLLYNRDPDIHGKLLIAANRALVNGGAKIVYTYPSLITGALKLVRRYKSRREDEPTPMDKISATFKFIHKAIDQLYKIGKGELSLRLYVDSASLGDQVNAEEASYEFFAEAFTIYEEAISDSRAQYQALCIIAGALQSTQNFSTDNYDTLVSKCALYGSKLLKKPDQCRAVYLASHLWWREGKAEFRDDKRVLECLQRALRVADACMDVAVSVELFVEILNRYLYYYDHGNTAVTVRYINGLIDLIQTNLSNNADEKISDSPRKHFERTLEYISQQKEADEKFRQIVW
jgi:vacuolar protein sorting-associated protein 35